MWNNILYSLTIISFYFFPFLIKEKDLIFQLKKLFFNRLFLIFLFIFFLLTMYINFYFVLPQFQYHSPLEGGGIIKKILIFAKITNDKNILLYLISFLSFIIISIFNKNTKTFLIIMFFIIISIFLYPLFQETYDPILLILILLVIKKNTFFFKKDLYVINFYFFIFLAGAIIYYI